VKVRRQILDVETPVFHVENEKTRPSRFIFSISIGSSKKTMPVPVILSRVVNFFCSFSYAFNL